MRPHYTAAWGAVPLWVSFDLSVDWTDGDNEQPNMMWRSLNNRNICLLSKQWLCYEERDVQPVVVLLPTVSLNNRGMFFFSC